MARFDDEDAGGDAQDALPTRPLPEAAPGAAAAADVPTQPYAPHVPVADLPTAPFAPVDPVAAPPPRPDRPRRAIWPWVLLAVILLGAIAAILVGMNLDTGDRPLSPVSPTVTPTPEASSDAPAPDETVPETPDQTPDEPPPTTAPTPEPTEPAPDPTSTTSP